MGWGGSYWLSCVFCPLRQTGTLSIFTSVWNTSTLSRAFFTLKQCCPWLFKTWVNPLTKRHLRPVSLSFFSFVCDSSIPGLRNAKHSGKHWKAALKLAVVLPFCSTWFPSFADATTLECCWIGERGSSWLWWQILMVWWLLLHPSSLDSVANSCLYLYVAFQLWLFGKNPYLLLDMKDSSRVFFTDRRGFIRYWLLIQNVTELTRYVIDWKGLIAVVPEWRHFKFLTH